MSEIEFPSGGVRCRGVHLRGVGDASFPDGGLAVAGKRPCVLLANGFSLTVDSGLLPFAERFAQAGIDALAFDYRHFGASDGEPRQLLSIERQLADYAAAIAYARTLEGVDRGRIVLWGYSLAGGHAIAAAVADGRVAGVISMLPAVDGLAATLLVARSAGAAQLGRLLVAGARDWLGAVRGRPPLMLKAVGAPGELAAITTSDALPGVRAIAGPSWRNEVAARVALAIGAYRPGRQAERLPCPLLVQIADRDAVVSVRAAQEAAFRATGRAEVRTYPIGHFDVMAGDAFERAVADQLLFLRRHLGAQASAPAAARAA